MPAQTQFALGSDGQSPYIALLAKGCQAAYDLSPGGAADNFGDVLGSGAPDKFDTSGLVPAAAFYAMGADNYVIILTGTTSLRQAMVYEQSASLRAADADIGGTGKVNRYIKTIFDTSQLKARLITLGAPVNYNGRFVIAAHSMGFATACLVAAWLRTYYPLSYVTSVLGFGGVKIGDLDFRNHLATLCPRVYTYGLRNDPIPYWPSENLSQTVHALSGFGASAASRRERRLYRGSGSFTRIFSGGALGISPEIGNLTLTQLRNVLVPFMSSGDLPVDHQIQNYVLELMRGWRSDIRGTVNPTSRALLDAALTLQAPVNPPESQIPTGSLPTLIPATELPTPPPGGSNDVPKQRQTVRVQPTTMNTKINPKRPRVQIGDGMARKVAKKIAQLMLSLQAHDAKVKNKTRKGTLFITNPSWWDERLSENYWELYEIFKDLGNR